MLQVLPAPEAADHFLDMPVDSDAINDVPGWAALEAFLKETLDIRAKGSLDNFQKFYNHYLKRFPFHYFSDKIIPGIDFALYLPLNGQRRGINHSNYLVAMAVKDRPLVMFRQKIPSQVKSRKNFYHLTLRLIETSLFFDKNHMSDVLEIDRICKNPSEMHRSRRSRFHGFLARAERRIHRTKHRRHFKGKWDAIRTFLDSRDRYFIESLIDRLKTRHISFEAAHAAAKVCGSRNLALYNWIAAAQNPEALRNRTQFSEYFPWLAQALAHQREREGYESIESVVDEGRPLIPALQALFSDDASSVSQNTIRKTMWMDIDSHTRGYWTIRPILKDMGRHLAHFALEEGQIERFSRTIAETGRICSYLDAPFLEIFAHMSPAEQSGFFTADIRTLPRSYDNTADYLREVYSKTVLPYFLRRALESGFGALPGTAERYIKGGMESDSFLVRNTRQHSHPPYLRPMGNVSFLTMVHLSETWHANQNRYVRYSRSIDMDGDLAWPSLIEKDIKAPQNFTITPRHCKDHLHEEYEDMNHCINGYAQHCLGLVYDEKAPHNRYYSHIFKLAAKGGRHRATLELREPYYGPKPPRLAMGQIENRRTVANKMNVPKPDAAESLAAAWFLAQLNNGKIKIDWNRIHAERAKMQEGKSVEGLFAEIGFDPRDVRKCEEAYLNIRPYLPERFRSMGYQQWIESMNFDREADWLFARERLAPAAAAERRSSVPA